MPTKGRCYGCGRVGRLTAEHFIHHRIGQVALGDDMLGTAEVRLRLPRGYDQAVGHPENVVRVDGRIDGVIHNLFCRECNGGWADRLERTAGDALWRFTFENGGLQVPVVHRWLFFLSLKFLWYYEPAAVPRPQSLLDNFARARNPTHPPPHRLLAGRVDGSPEHWDFAAAYFGGPGPPALEAFLAVVHGVIWCLASSELTEGSHRLSLPLVEAVEGRRWSELALIPEVEMENMRDPVLRKV